MPKGNVNYDLVVYDELPPPATRSGGGRSILNEQLETIVENEKVHGRPVRIGLYSQGTAATAAKNVLQQRKGRNAAVAGWKFYTRPVPVNQSPDADVLRGLFAVYTPESIVPGALEAHEAAERKRVADLEVARAGRAKGEDEYDDDEDEDDEDEDEDEDEDDEGVGVGDEPVTAR
jgi:hypothetical protein